ncbi:MULTISPECIES: sigma-70 family RNA polymerase sigma factor [unclassified Roseitalea]|uniref:RNA polymerase sigma factor n=1 Tax=unclassified Roseitalea TaxID=2639107 RepID=UPI00273E6D41|nr:MULTISPECIES: sigma-70 family RNA polymerase sigma factor [unclassified Roseitalea]
MSIGQDDEALAKAVASGDERAFGLLVSRHLERVRAVANGFTGNAADADEIAQDVFVAVWSRVSDWRPDRGRFSTWLYRITANKCIDHGRRRGRRVAWAPIEDVAHRLAGNDDPERELAGRDELAAVRRAIAGLPDRQRMALLLSVSAGLANGEIALTMGISRGAVEQLLVRARTGLRAAGNEKDNDHEQG